MVGGALASPIALKSMSAIGTKPPSGHCPESRISGSQSRDGRRPVRPPTSLLIKIELPSDVDLLSDLDCVADLDSEVAHGAFDL